MNDGFIALEGIPAGLAGLPKQQPDLPFIHYQPALGSHPCVALSSDWSNLTIAPALPVDNITQSCPELIWSIRPSGTSAKNWSRPPAGNGR
jgi:hypothetical protein